MKIQRVLLIVSLALVLITALVVWQTSKAYIECCHWSSNSGEYRYDSSLPLDFRSATDFGASVWTDVSTSSWVWYYSPTRGNYVKYGSVDGKDGTLAVTTISYNVPGYTINWIEIKYDSAESWYTGSGTPSGSQVDLSSAAAHEFGHGVGLAHTQPNYYCDGGGAGSADATMCDGQAYGNTYKRSLEPDDRNGLTDLYP